ncbi:MAG: acetyl-CoA carboxylase biotin carboxyl carrier protein [Cyanobacteria bacterium SZAS LIN-2]|nr:acetyl-CoA carboxylase biotin carboxyl carrier protein [Cyanobacteria bacterium SZAS LIN-3]MBS1995455.1 acetyl-CoA carboxylase biotin carboxyl carrier protein [Cyanobacteria bacterium SZAS LIN-2]MBS2006274.1 acetyl-CoA carboxylase biotin carboxyl carrier protein [Cyanobacteria bacterium SZAS TMP-1]
MDLQQIKELLGIVSSTDVTELTIEFGDQKITVKKTSAAHHTHLEVAPLATRSPAQVVHHEVAPRPAAAPAPVEAPPKADPVPAEDNGHAGSVAITSPMVGTFYGAPSPTASNFVKVGDKINVGQTVCIIEAMKLMNDLPSEVAGKIVKICVDSGTTVEYGQTLFLVDPKG